MNYLKKELSKTPSLVYCDGQYRIFQKIGVPTTYILESENVSIQRHSLSEVMGILENFSRTELTIDY